MTQARKDNNYIPTALGVLDSDGVTPTLLQVNPTTHGLIIDDDTTGSDAGNGNRDNNGEPVMKAVSSSDGTTIKSLYINSAGKLLINSN